MWPVWNRRVCKPFCQVFSIRCCADNLGILLLWCLVIARSSTRQVDLLFKACEVTWYSHLSGMTCSPTPGLWVSYRQITLSPPPPLTLSHTHYRIIQKCFNTSRQSNMYAKHINYLEISTDFTLPLTPLQVDFIPITLSYLNTVRNSRTDTFLTSIFS